MKATIFKMKSQLAVGMLVVFGYWLLATGCSSNSKPAANENGGLPQIIHQPEDADVATNQGTTLSVKVQRDPGQSYRFAWFREVPVAACANPPDEGGMTLDLQTNRSGWDSENLQIAKADPADEGNYVCVITHEGTPELPQELVSWTRPTYVKVYRTPNLPRSGTNMVILPQAGTRQLGGTSPRPFSICGLTSCNCGFTFKQDDEAIPFISHPRPSTCQVWVNILNPSNPNGLGLRLNPSQYAVEAIELDTSTTNWFPDGTYVCATTNQSTRVFPAPANKAYWFGLFLVNAPTSGATYQLNVQFL